jgi:hypothetical protein
VLYQRPETNIMQSVNSVILIEIPLFKGEFFL